MFAREETGTLRSLTFAAGLLVFLGAATAARPTEVDDSLGAQRAEQELLVALIERSAPAMVFIGGGSGFVVSREGHVLTNEHVISNQPAEGLEVFLVGGRRLLADILGHDPGGDLALLKLREDPGVEPLRLGDSDKLQVGQPVVAMGDPFLLASEEMFIRGAPPTYEPSVSFGIISALHRFSDTYFDAIQVDVAVNRGNSGGPLLNLDGEIIGINGKIETRLEIGINTGVGYAIPANQIRRFLEPLKAAGGDAVQHGSILGLHVEERAGGRRGLPVDRVDDGSLAARLGFRKGDLLVKIAGYPVPTRNRFQGILGTFPAGSEVDVIVARGAETFVIEAPLIEHGPAFLGVRTATEETGGVRIVEVEPGRAGSRGGLLSGDIIREFDGEAIAETVDLLKVLKTRTAGDLVRLRLLRRDAAVELELRLGGRGLRR